MMSDVLNQETFSGKTMLEDARGRLIPQYYDTTTGIFKPNATGLEVEVTHNKKHNPYQTEFSNKNLLVDRKKRPIPQYYDTSEALFKPLTQNPNTEQSGDFGKFKWVYNEGTESLDLVVKP